MAKLLNNKQEIVDRFPRTPTISPLPPIFVMKYLSLQEELKQTKQRLLELENRVPEEKVIVLRDVTKEEAKQEIRQLFLSGRTLYYSDIVKELGLDLETVVDICNELEEEKEIGVDARVSQ